jgi:hypothetical protein
MDSPLRILFVCRDTYYFDYPLIAEILSANHQVEPYALTLSTKTMMILKNKHPHAFKEILNIDDYFYENDDFQNIPEEEKIAYLQGVEKKLHVPSLFHLLYVDRTIMTNNYQDLLSIAYGMAKFSENILRMEFHSIFGEIGTFIEYLLSEYCDSAGISFLTVMSSRFKGKIAFYQGPNGTVPGFKKLYEAYKKKTLTREEEDLFDDFYADYMRGAEKPEYAQQPLLAPKVRNIVQAYRERASYQNKSRFVLESFDSSSIMQLIGLRLKKHFIRTFVGLTDIFSSVDSCKFLYYPLPVQPEISTLLYAPYYVDQFSLIENIAKSIPVGYVLAVKEHPEMFGLRNIAFYRQILELPNVRLIDPLKDSYQVIKASAGVIVLSGTAGLESIILQKPVVVLGNVFFDIYDLACKVDNIKELPQALKHYLAEFDSDMNSLKNFVVAYLKSTYEGILDDAIAKKEHLTRENLSKIAHAIFQVCSNEIT